MPEQRKLENGWFYAEVEKVVRIVLYGPAISQADCRKAGPYQLPYNNYKYCQSDQKFSSQSLISWMPGKI